MMEEKPVVYILRGDDREAVESNIHTFFKSLGAPDMAGMNTTHLEGKSITLNDLRSAALALPFLTARRLVVLDDALAFMDKDKSEAQRARLIELLDSLPPTTALVLVIPDSQKRRKRGGVWESYWVTLNEKHWLMQWASSSGNKAFIQDCLLPTDRQMADWIRKKAAELGGSFTPSAAQKLAGYLGNNTQRTFREIEKLLTYVNYERPVDDVDVIELSIREEQSDIFSLVDAMGLRDGETAIRLLHLLLDDMPFNQLFPMVIRQFRLILQTREILDMGGGEQEVAKTLGMQNFVARKIIPQARLFTLASLESIYHHLLEIDLAMKTRYVDGSIAMDVLIAQLANQLI